MSLVGSQLRSQEIWDETISLMAAIMAGCMLCFSLACFFEELLGPRQTASCVVRFVEIAEFQYDFNLISICFNGGELRLSQSATKIGRFI